MKIKRNHYNSIGHSFESSLAFTDTKFLGMQVKSLLLFFLFQELDYVVGISNLIFYYPLFIISKKKITKNYKSLTR